VALQGRRRQVCGDVAEHHLGLVVGCMPAFGLPLAGTRSRRFQSMCPVTPADSRRPRQGARRWPGGWPRARGRRRRLGPIPAGTRNPTYEPSDPVALQPLSTSCPSHAPGGGLYLRGGEKTRCATQSEWKVAELSGQPVAGVAARSQCRGACRLAEGVRRACWIRRGSRVEPPAAGKVLEGF